mmetsp:Transcript_3097/g.6424  ORF Transcript_3097/g.6424 Transcript_3097/m.6424 type:complete len:360 (+) Transcript_3097:929-2008(+)
MLKKSSALTTGGSSFPLGTSFNTISIAPWSDGEHGENLSLTLRKKRALEHNRTGSNRADLTIVSISDPEKNSVLRASSRMSSSLKLLGVSPILSLNSSALATSSGRGMYTLRSKRLLIAGSSSHGMLVAPRTRMPSESLPTPCICTRNSVLILLVASCSPSLRLLQRLSISSMKMIEGLRSRAIENSVRTSLSLSPMNLATRSDALALKKVPLHSVAQAFAKKDLPVPGGPYNNIPFHGFSLPTNSSGNRVGRMTASFSASLAPCSPATSVQLTFGFVVTIALDKAASRPALASSEAFLRSSLLPPTTIGPAGASCDLRNFSISSMRFMNSVAFRRKLSRIIWLDSNFTRWMKWFTADL